MEALSQRLSQNGRRAPHNLLDQPRPRLYSGDELDSAVSPCVVSLWTTKGVQQSVGCAGSSLG
eukprot:scaffold1004_cov73-Isochrysis_galbana.AAC.1